MPEKFISFEKEGQDNQSCIVFNGFIFPEISSFSYSLDGPDKSLPDRLFIRDKSENFILTIEKDGMNLLCENSSDYENFELKLSDRTLQFFYPAQKLHPKIKMGYFVITFFDECHSKCSGQLNMISLGKSYIDNLLNYPDLIKLFQGIKVYNI